MSFKREWITDGLDSEATKNADEMGLQLKNAGVSTSQIRNVFGEIKKIQALGLDKKEKGRLVMITPKLAYAVGRAGKREKGALEDLMKNVEVAVSAVEKSEKNRNECFNRFVDYMEAVVAYHRYHGGSN